MTTPSPRLALPLLDGASARDFEPFLRAVRATTGLALSVLPVASHAAIESVLDRGAAELGWAPPLVALDLVTFGTARVIAAVSREGKTSYPSLLVVRRDGPIRTLDDLPGARVAWVSRLSAAGYEVPRLYLEACGLAVGDLFREEIVAGGHLTALDLLASERVDVAACYGVRGHAAAALELPLHDPALRILAVAGPVPSDVIVARRSLDRDVADAIARALTTLDARALAPMRELLAIERFVVSHADHLLPLSSLRSLARAAAAKGVSEAEVVG